MISILIPVYNGVEFLEECIASVMEQTYTDWEVWIGINGHGAEGGEVAPIAKRFTDPRIHVVIQGPPLSGKVESLNHLVSLTTSEWICILDCDDKWERMKLAHQVTAASTIAKDAAVIGTFCRYFGDLHNEITLPIGYVDPQVLQTFNPIINSSAMIKRQYCKWIYNEDNMGVEDFYMWMEISLQGGKLFNLPEFLTWHRIHTTSAFNSKGYSDNNIRAWYCAALR